MVFRMSNLHPPPLRKFPVDYHTPWQPNKPDNEPAPVDLPPPESVRQSQMRVRQMAIEYVKTWAKDHGYRVSIARSLWTDKKRPSSVHARVYVWCSRSGTRRSRGSESSYASKKTNCPFQIMITLHHDAWHVEHITTLHNHDEAGNRVSLFANQVAAAANKRE